MAETTRALAPPGVVMRAVGRATLAGRRAWTFARYCLGLEEPGVAFITDSRDWSIYWDGHYIGRTAREAVGLRFDLTEDDRGHYGKVVHYGSQFFLTERRYLGHHASSRLVFSWFHGEPADESPPMRACFRNLPESARHVELVVTSCHASREVLLSHGWPAERIVLLPLGVDLAEYRPPSPQERAARRQVLGIPDGAFVVGSFQKDGVGWEEGLEPKLVKGPDVLVEALGMIARERPDLYVVLLGPARGYVKAGLERRGVRYRHEWLPDYRAVCPYYDALDCYLITSRSEGGPKGLVESMAKGVPVVSTRMGMPADVLADGRAGLLADVGDARGLADRTLQVAADRALALGLAGAALERVRDFDWAGIARQYCERVYRPLLSGSARTV